jgi:hypothetical protein
VIIRCHAFCKKNSFPVCASPQARWGDTLHAGCPIGPGLGRSMPRVTQLSNLAGYARVFFFGASALRRLLPLAVTPQKPGLGRGFGCASG